MAPAALAAPAASNLVDIEKNIADNEDEMKTFFKAINQKVGKQRKCCFFFPPALRFIISQFLFLIVCIGVEMDLVGLCVALPGYLTDSETHFLEASSGSQQVQIPVDPEHVIQSYKKTIEYKFNGKAVTLVNKQNQKIANQTSILKINDLDPNTVQYMDCDALDCVTVSIFTAKKQTTLLWVMCFFAIWSFVVPGTLVVGPQIFSAWPESLKKAVTKGAKLDKAKERQMTEGPSHRPADAKGSLSMKNYYAETFNSFSLAVPDVMLGVQWYHIIPGIRMLMVLNLLDGNDVEAMFKINTLSSLTLGVFQLAAIGMTVQALPEGGNLHWTVYVNMCSQALNWSITLMYYGTSIPSIMGDACNVHKINNLYDKLLTRNAFAMAQDSSLFLAGDAKGKKEHVEERRKARQDLITQMMERCMGSRWENSSNCDYLNTVVTDDNIKQIIEILRLRTLKCVASARAH